MALAQNFWQQMYLSKNLCVLSYLEMHDKFCHSFTKMIQKNYTGERKVEKCI